MPAVKASNTDAAMTSKSPPIRIGIIGLQHMHPRFYISVFNAVQDTLPVAVVEPDAALRKAFCTDFKLAGYATTAEMLHSENLDAAALFLPHADFPEVAVECAEHGLHLMVDKPMAATTRGAEQIVQAAAKHGVQLTTGYYFRIHPGAIEIRHLVQSGAIGRVVSGEINWPSGGVHRYLEGHSGWMLDKNRSGGGPLHNLGVHYIDLLRHILGDEVVTATGRTAKFSTEYSIEDICTAQLEFSKGALVSLSTAYLDLASQGHIIGGVHFSLIGTHGMITWNLFTRDKSDQFTLVSHDTTFPNRTVNLEMDGNIHEFMGIKYVEAFVRAIRGAQPMFVTGQDGLAALKVVEAVYRSARTLRWEKLAQQDSPPLVSCSAPA